MSTTRKSHEGIIPLALKVEAEQPSVVLMQPRSLANTTALRRTGSISHAKYLPLASGLLQEEPVLGVPDANPLLAQP